MMCFEGKIKSWPVNLYRLYSCVCNTVNSPVLPSNYMYSQFKYQTYHIFLDGGYMSGGVFGTGVIVQRVYVRGYMSGGYLS